jgi:hypothetical protein
VNSSPNCDCVAVHQATGLAPLVAIVSLLFGGFYINSDNIPDSIEWVQELSFFKYVSPSAKVEKHVRQVE